MLGRGVGLALVLSSKYGQVKLQLTWCVSVQVHLFYNGERKGQVEKLSQFFGGADKCISGELYKRRIIY